MGRLVLLPVLVFCIALVAVGCTGGDSGSTPTYDSPEAAFDAAKAAGQKEDWRGLCATMTPDTVDAMAGGLVMVSSMLEAFSGMAAQFGGEKADASEMQEALKALKGVMTKHGASPPAQSDMAALGQGEPDPEALQKLVAPIKDRAAFIADMLAAMKNVKGPGGAGDPGKAMAARFGENVQLTDVTIAGDSATANISTDGKKEPIEFKKVDGSWRLAMQTGPGTGGGAPGGK